MHASINHRNSNRLDLIQKLLAPVPASDINNNSPSSSTSTNYSSANKNGFRSHRGGIVDSTAGKRFKKGSSNVTNGTNISSSSSISSSNNNNKSGGGTIGVGPGTNLSGKPQRRQAPVIYDDGGGSVADITIEQLRAGQNLASSKLPFLWKLHAMLDDVEKTGDDNIVSWLDHGKAFRVHKPKLFVQKIIPYYFKQSKYKSFQRQLHLYQFVRTPRGPEAGAYAHPKFIRDCKALCLSLSPKKSKSRIAAAEAAAAAAAAAGTTVTGTAHSASAANINFTSVETNHSIAAGPMGGGIAQQKQEQQQVPQQNSYLNAIPKASAPAAASSPMDILDGEGETSKWLSGTFCAAAATESLTLPTSTLMESTYSCYHQPSDTSNRKTEQHRRGDDMMKTWTSSLEKEEGTTSTNGSSPEQETRQPLHPSEWLSRIGCVLVTGASLAAQIEEQSQHCHNVPDNGEVVYVFDGMPFRYLEKPYITSVDWETMIGDADSLTDEEEEGGEDDDEDGGGWNNLEPPREMNGIQQHQQYQDIDV